MSRRSPSSTIFGSMRMKRTWSGVALNRIDMIMALMPTDLPEPVKPPMSRCGMRAGRRRRACPWMSLPSARVSGSAGRSNSGTRAAGADDGLAAPGWAPRCRPCLARGCARSAPPRPERPRREVLGQVWTAGVLDPRVEAELIGRDHRAGADVYHLASDLELLALAGQELGNLDQGARVPGGGVLGRVEEGELGQVVALQLLDEVELLLNHLLRRGRRLRLGHPTRPRHPPRRAGGDPGRGRLRLARLRQRNRPLGGALRHRYHPPHDPEATTPLELFDRDRSPVLAVLLHPLQLPLEHPLPVAHPFPLAPFDLLHLQARRPALPHPPQARFDEGGERDPGDREQADEQRAAQDQDPTDRPNQTAQELELRPPDHPPGRHHAPPQGQLRAPQLDQTRGGQQDDAPARRGQPRSARPGGAEGPPPPYRHERREQEGAHPEQAEECRRQRRTDPADQVRGPVPEARDVERAGVERAVRGQRHRDQDREQHQRDRPGLAQQPLGHGTTPPARAPSRLPSRVPRAGPRGSCPRCASCKKSYHFPRRPRWSLRIGSGSGR